MGDSSLSASELRSRYAKGGSLTDDNLSASQLRARYNVQSNTKDFSSKEDSGVSLGPAIAIVVVVLALVGVIGFVLKSKGGQ